MNTKDIAHALESFSARSRSAVAAAEGKALEDAKREALASSSGPLTKRDLRRMDHPFARRHGQALTDPEIINKGGGDFYRDWQTEPVTATGDGTEGRLFNDSKSAHWLSRGGKGKSKMVARPVIARIKRLVQPERKRRTLAALKQAGQSVFNQS